MIKASQLIIWAKAHIGDGYVYGAVDVICDVALLKAKQQQYGASMGNGYYQLNGDYTRGRCARWLGKRVYDCSGIIKAGHRAISGVWQDVSAQGTYDQCSKRGTIGSMPLVPGCLVFIYSKAEKRIGHVGLYIGGGDVIEARGVNYGVVITRLSGRAWTHWGQPDWLEYDLKPDEGKATAGIAADAGDHTGMKPDDPLSFEASIDILAKKAGITAEYWKARKGADPYFAALVIKVASAWK